MVSIICRVTSSLCCVFGWQAFGHLFYLSFMLF